MQLVLSDTSPGGPFEKRRLVAPSGGIHLNRDHTANPFCAHAVATWERHGCEVLVSTHAMSRRRCPSRYLSSTMIAVRNFGSGTPTKRPLHQDKDMAIDNRRPGGKLCFSA
jgi:hypothetical protein